MCTAVLPPSVKLIAVKYIISRIKQHGSAGLVFLFKPQYSEFVLADA